MVLKLRGIRAPKARVASRGAEGAEGDGAWGGGVPSPLEEGSGEGAVPSPEFFLIFYLKW